MSQGINKRSVGAGYEKIALEYAIGQGALLVEKNFRCRRGEIDLILKDGAYLVFAEVKYRAGSAFGTAAEAVGPKKAETICRVSDFYRYINKIPEDSPVRYDVFAIDSGQGERGAAGGPVRVKWIRDAFFYRPPKSGRFN